ncbi:MAG: hypothetical protein ACFB50_03165 [Rubrobacteraceae bacterium]
MFRAVILALTVVAVLAGYAIWRTSEPVRTLQTPELAPAPVAIRVPENSRPPDADPSRNRIGSFQQPAAAPEYEVLRERVARGETVRVVRLLVDTRSRSKADYELIAQALKARYAEYDAVTAEFTDTEARLDYNGAALIFNTVRGATYMGFFFGPPNDRGYYVRAAE